MAGPLHVRHNHDLHEMADMQAVRRGVKANVERDLVVVDQVAGFLLVRELGNQSSCLQFVKYSHVETSIFGGIKNAPCVLMQRAE